MEIQAISQESQQKVFETFKSSLQIFFNVDGAVNHEVLMQALQTLNETGKLGEIKLSAGEKEGRRKRETAQEDVRIFCKSL